LEREGGFKYLGTNIKDQNIFLGEIKSILKSGNISTIRFLFQTAVQAYVG
jgi:hypothetical protein